MFVTFPTQPVTIIGAAWSDTTPKAKKESNVRNSRIEGFDEHVRIVLHRRFAAFAIVVC